MLFRPQALAAAIVEPDPINGSRIVPSPNGSEARTIWRIKCWGFNEGCGAASRSPFRATDEGITSRNGSSGEILLNPPVFHLRRLSCTRPSQGFRNSPHGSQPDRGITETRSNSSSAFFGLSPPRSVWTNRMISPRFSNPAFRKGSYTKWETSGLVAIKTCAPGTKIFRRLSASVSKNKCSSFFSASVKTVKRGRGDLVQPSKEGGILQTPPRPFFLLSSCFS